MGFLCALRSWDIIWRTFIFFRRAIVENTVLFEISDEVLWHKIVDVVRLLSWLSPLPLLFGLGRLHPIRLLTWTVCASLALFVFGWFGPGAIWDDVDGLLNVWLFSLIVIFIVHELIQGAADDGTRIAN